MDIYTIYHLDKNYNTINAYTGNYLCVINKAKNMVENLQDGDKISLQLMKSSLPPLEKDK